MWLFNKKKQQDVKHKFRVVTKTIELELKKRFVQVFTEEAVYDVYLYGSTYYGAIKYLSLIDGRNKTYSQMINGPDAGHVAAVCCSLPLDNLPELTINIWNMGQQFVQFDEAFTEKIVTLPTNLIKEIRADKDLKSWKKEVVEYNVLEEINKDQ
jgi:hypothetical protein